MIWILLNLLLWSLAEVADSENKQNSTSNFTLPETVSTTVKELEESVTVRISSTEEKTKENEFLKLNATVDNIKLDDKNNTNEAINNTKNVTAVGFLNNLNNDTEILETFFKEVEICRKNYPQMDNKTFNLKLYGSLLRQKHGQTVENSFHCNISHHVIAKIKDNLTSLKTFKDIFILRGRNPKTLSDKNSNETLTSKASGTGDLKMVEDNVEWNLEKDLELKLGDDGVEQRPKLPYSHIYLGVSFLPRFIKETRVVDSSVIDESILTDLTEKGAKLQEQGTQEIKNLVSLVPVLPSEVNSQSNERPKRCS